MRIILFTLIFCLSIFASDTKIFHINGINTEENEARANLTKLKNTLKSNYKDQNLTYILAYNETGVGFADIIDCYNQKVAEYRRGNLPYNISLAEFISQVTLALFHLPSYVMTPAEVEQFEINNIINNTQNYTYTDTDSKNIVKTISDNVLLGNNIFIIAHSQGTLYANIIYDKLVEQNISNTNNTKILSVADVAAYMPNGDWLSSEGDPVIIGVKIFFTCMDFNYLKFNNLGHSLIDVYLKVGSELLTEFERKAKLLLETFEQKQFDNTFTFTFYGLAPVTTPGMSMPFIKDVNRSKSYYEWSPEFNVSVSGADKIYKLTLPTDQDLSGEYLLEWTFSDVNITKGQIQCGNKVKDINVTKYLVNNFGKIILSKSGNSYDCNFQ
jgi:hypothetical protein